MMWCWTGNGQCDWFKRSASASGILAYIVMETTYSVRRKQKRRRKTKETFCFSVDLFVENPSPFLDLNLPCSDGPRLLLPWLMQIGYGQGS